MRHAIWTMIGLLVVGAATAGALHQGRESVASEPVDLLDELTAGLNLTEEEHQLLAPELARIEDATGLAHARNLIWVGVECGCRGACLPGIIRGFEAARSPRVSDLFAADLTLDSLGDAMAAHLLGEDVSKRTVALVQQRTRGLLLCSLN